MSDKENEEEAEEVEESEEEAGDPQDEIETKTVVETIEGLSLDEQAINFDTMRHIEMVRNLINRIVVELISRAQKHDQSKLAAPEVAGFAKNTASLKDMTYDSPEYRESLKNRLKTALDHHYAKNRHHPQHFKNGVNDMNIIDVLEMFIDWKASSTRHHDGNLRQSIEKNADRFGLSPQLVKILENSMELVEDPE